MKTEKKAVAAAGLKACSICGLSLENTALHFSIERHRKAICADCVRGMFPSMLPENGITIQWQLK